MNLDFDFQPSQILTSIFFFLTVMPMTVMAIHGFSSWSETTDNKFVQNLVSIWILLIIPITLYFCIFTKFHNPFKKEIKN